MCYAARLPNVSSQLNHSPTRYGVMHMFGIIEVLSAIGGSVTAAAVLTEAVLARIERHDRLNG